MSLTREGVRYKPHFTSPRNNPLTRKNRAVLNINPHLCSNSEDWGMQLLAQQHLIPSPRQKRLGFLPAQQPWADKASYRVTERGARCERTALPGIHRQVLRSGKIQASSGQLTESRAKGTERCSKKE